VNNRIFLGGTCAGDTWREHLIKMIQVPAFNPVTDNWNEEFQKLEEHEKVTDCNIHLYVITSKMIGVYSIAEVVESTQYKDKITILHIIPDGFEGHQLKSLKATVALVRRNGGIAYIDPELSRTARVINNCFKE
jgi:hypothetical protein